MRFIKIRIRNMDRKKGEKYRKIPVTEADGTVIALPDGFEGEVSEYVYNSLNDAIETLYFYKGTEKNINEIDEKSYARFDIIKMSDFYTKEKIKEEKPKENLEIVEEKKPEIKEVNPETKKKKGGRPKKLIPALEGA